VAVNPDGTPLLPYQLRLDRGRKLRRRKMLSWAVALAVLAGTGVIAEIGRPPAGSSIPVAAATTSTTFASLGESTIQITPSNTVAGAVPGVSGGPPETSAAIIAENALPGTTGWKITDPSKNHQIEGYANQVSIDPGQPVTLYVSTTAPSYHVEVFRMGWYGGLGARLVDRTPEMPGMGQSAPTFTPGINMVETRWTPSVVLATDNWPPGDYLFKLVASSGPQSYIPLTVRDDASTAAYAIINAVTTWQAYNLWGGYDLYEGKNGAYATRSRVVSFDRPYSVSNGAADFLGLEYPLVSLVESLGLDVTYLTDVDLQRQPDPLLAHKAVISLGHDEYYSLLMRQNMTDARDHGVNLAFLGANAIYRHIRFASSPLGADRHEICYKDAQEDPLYGKDNADVTVDWRDPPTNDPESQLIGDFYQCNPVEADMVVVDPKSWLFAGTNAAVGQKLPGVVSSEYDRYDPGVPSPPDVEILTHSPLVCRGQHDYADAIYYTAPSGAGVFASGAIAFVGNINLHCEPAGCNGQILGRLVENLLAVFGQGPAGLVHPSDPAESSVVAKPPIVASYGGAESSAAAVGGSGQSENAGP